MDQLAKQLRKDAEQIDVGISPELDDRIRASLAAVTPERSGTPSATASSGFFWWASSLTGVAAALTAVVLVNLQAPEPITRTSDPVVEQFPIPNVPWRVQTAVLTSPLEQEFEDLQSDLKKAEQTVKDELESIF